MNRQHTETDINRAIRSWTGERSITGDDAAGVAALTHELMRQGMSMNFAARAAAVMARDGIRSEDRWTGSLSGLADLGADDCGVKMHRAAVAGSDSEVEIDVGRVYYAAVDEARALRHARAH